MSKRCTATHTIRIAAPVGTCQRFFTPAGEELWVDGWRPNYQFPEDGRTEPGMVFTTGSGDDFTVWNLVDFDTQAHYARYARVTPALRAGFVEVRCTAVDAHHTDVQVTYTLTALTDQGDASLAAFQGDAYVAMIEDWKTAIDARLPDLLVATIR